MKTIDGLLGFHCGNWIKSSNIHSSEILSRLLRTVGLPFMAGQTFINSYDIPKIIILIYFNKSHCISITLY